jgi:phosphoribosyl 1,2-cyclic phosphodiesterase
MPKKSLMTVQFWGVRGSIPSPGAATAHYGGNTVCVTIDTGGNKLLVLDAGTGIRNLGKALEKNTTTVFVLWSHAHWDHIQGFPFFHPIYQPHRTIYLFPTFIGQALWCSALGQMDGAHFPVIADDLPSHTRCITEGSLDFLAAQGFCVTPIAINHPGGGTGYRIEHAGHSVVYLTDNELAPPYKQTTDFDTFADFCRHADLLIHDAQYLENDMPHKHGWGHSLVSQACALAVAAQVKHLVLFHHDPDRSDAELDAIQEQARALVQAHNRKMQCTVAYEGLRITLEGRG